MAANLQKGVTLIELMIVIGLIGIIAGLAAPAYQDSIQRRCQTDASQGMLSAFSQLRSEAILRSTSMTLVPRDGDWLSGTWDIMEANVNNAPTIETIKVCRNQLALNLQDINGDALNIDAVVVSPQGTLETPILPFTAEVCVGKTVPCAEVDVSILARARIK